MIAHLLLEPALREIAEEGAKISLQGYLDATGRRGVLGSRMRMWMESYDFIVTPTNARPALDITHDAANDDVIIDGVKCGITRQGWTSYQYPFNLTGHPAMAVPSGFGADGLPTSVQIIGKWANETDVLRLGALLERARPWAQHRPTF